MSEPYDPQAIEARWQARWREEGTYEVDNDDPRPPSYVLCMYPYPSGAGAHGPRAQLHLRRPDRPLPHDERPRPCCRPIGFDSFGLPAENAAIKTGEHPRPFTDARIEELTSLAEAARRLLRLAPRGRRATTRATSAGPSGSSCGSWRPAWPTGTRRRSTGARAARPCWPTSRCWPTARASARATWSSSATSSSGSSRSPTTPSSCSTTSTTSTGPSGSRPCSATGSAAPRAPSSTCRSSAHDAR